MKTVARRILKRLPPFRKQWLDLKMEHHRGRKVAYPGSPGFDLADFLVLRMMHGEEHPEIANYIDKHESKALAQQLAPSVRVPETYFIGEEVGQATEALKGLLAKETASIVKPAHSSGYYKIVRAESDIDPPLMQEMVNSKHYQNNYEFHYKPVKQRLLIEELIPFDAGSMLFPMDYKLYFANGKFLVGAVFSGRRSGTLKALPFSAEGFLPDPNLMTIALADPDEFNFDHCQRAIAVATQLQEPFTFVRVDLYVSEADVWFGEFTFSPGSGFFMALKDSKSTKEAARLLYARANNDVRSRAAWFKA